MVPLTAGAYPEPPSRLRGEVTPPLCCLSRMLARFGRKGFHSHVQNCSKRHTLPIRCHQAPCHPCVGETQCTQTEGGAWMGGWAPRGHPRWWVRPAGGGVCRERRGQAGTCQVPWGQEAVLL